MTIDDVLADLRSRGSAANVASQRRFGVTPRAEQLGVTVPAMRKLAKRIGIDHALAQKLWTARVHEARHVAAMIADSAKVTPALMERWVKSLDAWDICDQVCGNLFDRSPHAWDKAVQWAGRDEAFVKRAGFSLMAALAVHDKAAKNPAFAPLLQAIERAADDDRNFVRKAVNWALRSIGKRNAVLNRRAIACARRIAKRDTRAARWIASDALRELTSDAVQSRL